MSNSFKSDPISSQLEPASFQGNGGNTALLPAPIARLLLPTSRSPSGPTSRSTARPIHPGGRDVRPRPPLPSPRPKAPTWYLAEHFDSPEIQYSTAKMGMWIFIATEILMFGGLFCLYAVFRNLYPQAFTYGASFLDLGWGSINTAVLLLSSLTMALAIQCARSGQQQLIMLFLALTMICGIAFIGVKVIEYRHKIQSGLLWGSSFTPAQLDPQVSPGSSAGSAAATPTAPAAFDAAHARQLYLSTCAACHGPGGDGLEQLGLPLRTSALVKSSSSASLLEFIKSGRQPDDAASKMNKLMPPKGGNPFLSDPELSQIAAYVRSLAGAEGADAAEGTVAEAPAQADLEVLVPRWVATRPPVKDNGLAAQFRGVQEDSSLRVLAPGEPPAHAGKYFAMYFLMTGLHGFHMLIGLGVVGWLLWAASRWRFTGEYHTPLEVGGLYWHLVDVIWIFLFPLLYLVH